MKGQAATNLPFIIFLVAFGVLLVYLSVEFESGMVSGAGGLMKPSCSGILDCPFTYLGAFLALMSMSTSYAFINGTIMLVLGLGLAWALFELISGFIP